MSDPKSKGGANEFEELEPLPELETVSELEPLPELEELPATAVAMSAGTAAASAPMAPTAPVTAGADRAPLLLQKGALLLAVASLLPWLVDQHGWISGLGAKLCAAASAWILLQCVHARSGGKVAGALQGLIKKRFVAAPVARPKSGAEKVGALIDGNVPTPAHVLGLALLVLAFVLPFLDRSIGPNPAPLIALAELCMFALGAMTYVHIQAYRTGGKFNPLYPLMFLAAAIAGALKLVNNLMIQDWLGVLGALGACAAGSLAVYTMVVAMKQAKVEGDLKKKAASEARKAARGSGARGAARG